MPRLTDRQWEKLAEFYQEGHTMKECGLIWNVSIPAISRHFKVYEIPTRERFIPIRPETAEKLPEGHPLREEALSRFKAERGPLPEEKKRTVVSLDGKELEQKTYEKELTT